MWSLPVRALRRITNWRTSTHSALMIWSGAFPSIAFFNHRDGRIVMDNPSPLMRNMARRLLAAGQSDSDSQLQEAVLVNEKLRVSLTQFAGADGFAALLRRALALASEEVPALKSATVSADGHLEGLERLATNPGSVASAAAGAITAHVLGLLVTFIGESQTLRLVREAWPNISPSESPSKTEVDR